MLNQEPHTNPVGHVLVPAAAISALSILLVAGLSLLGILQRVNLLISTLVSRGKSAVYPQELPNGSVWLATVVFAFGLCFAILNVAGTWRRLVLWITTMVLVAGWAPVLSLAAFAPEIGGPLVAVVWAGVCAVVYAGNHRMACDPPAVAEKTSTHGSHAPR